MLPITTERGIKFWASRHICNRVRAICAHSRDPKEANHFMRRFGMKRAFRDRVLMSLAKDDRNIALNFNNPEMLRIPYNPGNVPIWECLQVTPCDITYWDDFKVWDDLEFWNECMVHSEAFRHNCLKQLY